MNPRSLFFIVTLLAALLILASQTSARPYPSGIEDYSRDLISNDPDIVSRLDFWQANYLLTEVLEILCIIKNPYSENDVSILKARFSMAAKSINEKYDIDSVFVSVSDTVSVKPVIYQIYKDNSE